MRILDKVAEFFPSDIEIKTFLLGHTTTMSVKKNSLINIHGNYNRNIYFIEKGLVRSFYYENGKEITTNFYPEGKLVANIDTLFNNEPTKYNIESIEDSELVYCNYKNLEEFCHQSLAASNFSRYILGSLMAQMSDRIASLQHMSAKDRYRKMMEEHPNILLRAPLGMVATYLGISPETLSRIRSGKQN